MILLCLTLCLLSLASFSTISGNAAGVAVTVTPSIMGVTSATGPTSVVFTTSVTSPAVSTVLLK